MAECRSVQVPGCGGGIVCWEGLEEGAGWIVERFPGYAVGSINTRVESENDRVYYLYVNEKGAGFAVWASLEGLARGCGAELRGELVPLIQDALAGDPRLVFITMIVEERMLR